MSDSGTDGSLADRALMDALGAVYDPGSAHLLDLIGVSPGWACLELGAGAGGVARMLAARSAPGGRVVATDLVGRSNEAAANVEWWAHDILAEPLPAAEFDFVHCRFLLMHLPGRLGALAKMADAVRPGGWLLLEESDGASITPAREDANGALFRRCDTALRRAGALSGTDFLYGGRLYADIQSLGLEEIGTEARALPATPALRRLMLLTVEAWASRLVATNIVSGPEVEQLSRLLADPSFHFVGPLCLAAWARAPLS